MMSDDGVAAVGQALNSVSRVVVVAGPFLVGSNEAKMRSRWDSTGGEKWAITGADTVVLLIDGGVSRSFPMAVTEKEKRSRMRTVRRVLAMVCELG